jgi:hypothetical protein
VACKEDGIRAYRVFVGKQEDLEDIRVVGSIILKLIIKKLIPKSWTGLVYLGTEMEFFEHGNKTLDSKKRGDFSSS